MTLKEEFLQLLAGSTIVQGLLTLMIAGGWLYMIMAQKPVPDTMDYALGIVIGFYFGAKVQNMLRRAEGLQRAAKDCE